MIKKKVLVQGSLKTLHDFFSSKFSFEFDPVAVLTDEVDKIAVIFRQGGAVNLLMLTRRKICRVPF